MIDTFRFLSAISISFVISGCSPVVRIYDGPKLPDGQVARIYGEDNSIWLGGVIYMGKIDFELHSRSYFLRSFPSWNYETTSYHQKVELLPGEHKIEFIWVYPWITLWNVHPYFVCREIVFLEAGQDYRVYRSSWLKGKLTLKNVKTGEIVNEGFC